MDQGTAGVHGALELPPKLPERGLLVGWSLEHEHRRFPIGFVPVASEIGPERGFLEPVLYDGGGHLMTIASTGAGKGIGCIIPALLRHPGLLIVVDPKGENFAVTARHRRERGQQVVLLDPFDVTGESSADGLNPLDLLVGEDMVDDAAVLADLICQTRPALKDPFWDERARQLVTGLLMYVVRRLPPALRSVAELRFLLNQSAADLAATAKDMKRSGDPEIEAMASILDSAEPRVRASIVSTAQNQVEFLRGRAVRAAVGRSSIDLRAVTDGAPLTVYLVVPPDKLESHGRLLRLWIGTLMTAIVRRRHAPEHRTLFILDEAAQLGTLSQLRRAITLLRGYGLQTWSFWQDLSQLQRLYPDDWETMFNNCRVHQMFGINNMRMARTVAELTGYRQVRELLDLDADEIVLMMAGDEAVIAQRPNYLTDPAFAGRFDPNPYHRREDEEETTPRRPQRRFERPDAAGW